MTSFDQALDPACFFTPETTLYRLVRTRYADLTGLGAALAPGRWNRLGEKAVYTSHEVGIPLLERLAHSPKGLIPSNLSLLRIKVAGSWIRSGERMRDHNTGSIFAFCPTLELAAHRFRNAQFPFDDPPKSFAVAVPSVIAPAWNVVLYPEAPGFLAHTSLQEIKPFHFDPRLFTEDAVSEEIP